MLHRGPSFQVHASSGDIPDLNNNTKKWKQPKWPSPDKWIFLNVVQMHIGILYGHKKEGSSVICNNTDGTGDRHINRNKSGTERQVPHDLTLMWNLQMLIP